MNINEEFPSKYLKSADLRGSVAKVKIDRVASEDIGGDRKLVLYFVGKDKGMVLNKTNARTIADVYGDETENWTDVPIEVLSMKVDFQGRMVDGLRVRVPPPARAEQRAAATAAFAPNARDRANAAAAEGEGRRFSQDDPNDDIPFSPEWR